MPLSELPPAFGEVPGQDPPAMIVPPPGPFSRQLAAKLRALESPSVAAREKAREAESGADQTPIVYANARGANVFDVDGNRYVDLVAGFGALPLGHLPKRVARAVEAQGERAWLALGDVYPADQKIALLERLARLFPEPGARVLLGLSGADAVTAAMKTALLATKKGRVIAFEGGYHGMSYAPLAACGLGEAYRAPFAEHLGEHVTFAPYPATDDAMASTMARVNEALGRGDVGAVLVEPVLGRGGCVVPPDGFLRALRAACDGAGALLVADEIWTGLGRSGAILASVSAGVTPDVVCLGKALGSGYPVSACIGRARVMDAWGEHGGAAIQTATHFGYALGCAAAIATLDGIAAEKLAGRAAEVGERWMTLLRARTHGLGVAAVRGRGLMVGVALDGGAARTHAAVRALLGRGYIVLSGGARRDVLTLTPPLDIDESLLTGFSAALGAVLAEIPAS